MLPATCGSLGSSHVKVAATGHGSWSSGAGLGTAMKTNGVGVEQGHQILGLAGPWGWVGGAV